MKTVYALTRGQYSDYCVDCLFENEADAKEAFAQCGGEEGDYEMESFVLFDSVPEIIAQHSIDKEYTPDGRPVDDGYYRVSHDIIKDEDDRRSALDKRIYLRNTWRHGSANRELHVTGPTREACEQVHQHYAPTLYSIAMTESTLNLEWSEGI